MDEELEPVSIIVGNNDSVTVKGTVEDRLLTLTTRLDDGTTGKVFSMCPSEKGPRWRCHACCFTTIGSRSILAHERSPSHMDTMVQVQPHPAEQFRPQTPPLKPRQTLLEISLAPGEPIPPGFEGEVSEKAEIQAKLDTFTAPLIGLEYLVELHAEERKEPQYTCILCDKRGDPRTTLVHLTSFNHRHKFIESHFPKIKQKFAKYFSIKHYRYQCHVLISVVAEWIEKRFGRLSPHACTTESFERKRESYTHVIVRDVHFSDKFGETFEEFFDENLFEPKNDPVSNVGKTDLATVPGCISREVVKRRSPSPPVVSAPGKRKKPNEKGAPKSAPRRSSLSPISSISSSSLSDSPRSNNSRFPHDKPPNFRRRFMRSRSRSREKSYSSRPRSRSRSRHFGKRSRSRSPRDYRYQKTLPWRRNDYAYNRPTTENSTRSKQISESSRWEEFKRGCVQIEDELEKKLLDHEKNPEKHPQYPEEWKKFWNRRYKELQAEHKDPTKHDFKPEWIDFWNRRMKEMHDMEVKFRKNTLRKKLNLPIEEPQPQPIKFKIAPKKGPSVSATMTSKCDPDSDPEVIIIENETDVELNPPKKTSMEKVEHKRSYSNRWDSDDSLESERYHPKREYRGGYSKPNTTRNKYGSSSTYRKEEKEDLDDGQLNIVAVLRLLTALEEKLGSLGPKVIDMLSTALAMEKAEANSAETLLDNDTNCVLFETVKEKLKGQLLAGLIEPITEKPVKNAIKKIASLLHMNSERKREKMETERIEIKSQPVSVPGVGEVDKEAIAKQIAAALIAQGRVDVSQAELEQLINAVVGMAQESQGSGNKITAAEYAAKLHSDTTAPKPATNNRLLFDNNMDSLSDSDLKTLLQNFKDLSNDEQHSLISYLKKMESQEPERVEKLRQFVNLGQNAEIDSGVRGENNKPEPIVHSRQEPRKEMTEDIDDDIEEIIEVTPANDSSKLLTIDSDEDDDDYSYEDVFKAASKKLNEKQSEEKELKKSGEDKTLDPNVVLNNAKMMIADIMGKIGQKNASTSASLKKEEPPVRKEPVKFNQANRNNVHAPPENQYPEPSTSYKMNPVYSDPTPPTYPTEFDLNHTNTNNGNYGNQGYNYNAMEARPQNTYVQNEYSNQYSDMNFSSYNNSNYNMNNYQQYPQQQQQQQQPQPFQYDQYGANSQYNQSYPNSYGNMNNPQDFNNYNNQPVNRGNYNNRGFY